MPFKPKITAELVKSVKRHEGLRLKAYQDSVGVWTIGYGRNLQTLEISTQDAEKWLKEDLITHAKEVLALPEVDGLTQNRKDVLIEMCFNLGLSRLLKFRKMWAAVRRDAPILAASEMLDSKWAKQVGVRADRLAEKYRRG